MVRSSGSGQVGLAQSGKVTPQVDWVRSGWSSLFRSLQVDLGQVRSVRSGQVRSDQSSQFKPGQSGQVRSIVLVR